MANTNKSSAQVAYGMTSRELEHVNSQDKDIARKSSRPKTSGRPLPITHSMHERTDTTLGAPPRDNNPPDASSANPLDPTKSGKQFVVPAITHGMKSDPQRGHYDPDFARVLFAEATRPAGDLARDLHAVLPATVTENGGDNG